MMEFEHLADRIDALTSRAQAFDPEAVMAITFFSGRDWLVFCARLDLRCQGLDPMEAVAAAEKQMIRREEESAAWAQELQMKEAGQ